MDDISDSHFDKHYPFNVSVEEHDLFKYRYLNTFQYSG